jgi:hypothetical protein
MLRRIDRLKKFISDYQEILIWLPPALAAVFLGFHFFPQLDPRSGIDGFGQIYGMLNNVACGIVVCFSSWLTKRAYFGVWSDEDMLQLRTFLVSASMTWQEKVTLLGAHLVDIGEWILCFVFWYLVVFSS